MDELEDDEIVDGYVCERCTDVGTLAWPLDEALRDVMPAQLARALQEAARCLAHDAITIHRAHVEAAHLAFGEFAWPLVPWLAARARDARPELGAGLLVAPPDACLVSPVENWEHRLASLLRLEAPEVVVEHARARLARAHSRPAQLEWDRVAAWPAHEAFAGTVAFGEIARTMAEHALPPMLDDASIDVLAAIDRVIETLVCDQPTLAFRHALAERAEHASDPRRARGLALAARFLDELGHTDLRTNQDTLVDDCHVALARVGLVDASQATHRVWMTRAVPRAWRRVSR